MQPVHVHWGDQISYIYVYIFMYSSYIEQVQHKYQGSIINDGNSIEEEVKQRIALGIKAYYTNQKFFKSRLVTKSSKLKLYRTVIRPIVTYASETWVLNLLAPELFF